MLIGSSDVTIEKQGRFKLPSDFVEQWAELELGPLLFATTLLDRRLLIYPRAHFASLMKDLSEQPSVSTAAMRLAHSLNRNGAQTTIDKDHRIAIPARLRKAAATHLAFEPPASALLVGCGNHLELLFDVEPVALSPTDADHLALLRIAPLSPQEPAADA